MSSPKKAGHFVSYFNQDVPDVVLRSLFLKYDQDGSGVLSVTEIRKLLVNDLGLLDKQAEAYVLLLDEDGNKAITFEELKKWLKSDERFKHINNKTQSYRLQKAVEFFKTIDTDGSGTIDKQEFVKLLAHIDYPAPEKADEAFKQLDVDGNNAISFSEFLDWLHWT